MWHRKLTLVPSPKVEGGARVAHMAPIMRYVASHARALEAAKAREIRKIRAQSDWGAVDERPGPAAALCGGDSRRGQ